MSNKDLTLIIMTCDAFSDLWEGQIGQLERWWPDHPEKVLLVTDKPTERTFEGVDVFPAGGELEWSERLHLALEQISTEYVFFTLDDYFLIGDVPNDQINTYVQLMKDENYDYIRLFHRRKKWTLDAIEGVKGLRGLNPDKVYAICLYAGLWRREFMLKASETRKNAWQFEVSLRRAGNAYGAKCAVCMDRKIYPFLDVVRKGKLLRKAARYFRHHDIYHGNRGINSFWYEFKLNVRSFGTQFAPEWLVNWARNFMIKRGHHYYSQEG